MKYIKLFETYNEAGIIKLRETIDTKKAIGNALDNYLHALKIDQLDGQYSQNESRAVYSKTIDGRYTEGIIDITKKQNKYDVAWRNNNFFKTEYTLLKEWFQEHNMIYTIKKQTNQPIPGTKLNPKEDIELGNFRKWKKDILIEEYNVITIMYIKINEIEEFIKSINKFTTSSDLGMYIDAKKYNV